MLLNLDHYLRAFRTLHVNRAGERASPHKPCMLLAVLGMAEAGDLAQNRIRFDPALPVSARRDEIRATLERHQVIVVCGETGSGKTTQLPKILIGRAHV